MIVKGSALTRRLLASSYLKRGGRTVAVSIFALGIMSAASSYAGTVKKVDVYPINNWSVDLNPSVVKEDAACSLTRNYFKNYKVHLARDANDVVSVIVTPPAEIDSWYGNIVSVQMFKPGIEGDRFVPKSKKGGRLEYILERQVSDYEDYMQGASIRIELEKMSYHILLQSFSEAMQVLEGCTITKTGRVAEYEEDKMRQEMTEYYQANPAMLPDLLKSSPEQMAFLNGKDKKKKRKGQQDEVLVSSLIDKLSLIEQEKEALRERLEVMEQSNLGKIKNTAVFSKEKAIYDKQIIYLNKQIESLVRENEKIRRSKIRYQTVEVPQSPVIVEAMEDERYVRARLTALTHQNMTLKSQIDSLKSNTAGMTAEEQKLVDEKVSALEQDVARLAEENEKLMRHRSIAETVVSRNLKPDPVFDNADISALSEDKLALYNETEKLDDVYKEQGDLHAMGRVIKDLETQVYEVADENAGLSQESELLKEQKEDLEQDLESLSAEYEDLTLKVQGQDGSAAAVDPDVNITAMTYRSMRAYEDLPEGEQLPVVNLDAGEQKALLQEMSVKLDDLNKENAALKTQLEQAHQRIEALVQSSASVTGEDDRGDSKYVHMSERITALTQQNTLLMEELKDLRVKAASAAPVAQGANVDAVQELTKLDNQIQVLKIENERLREALDAVTIAQDGVALATDSADDAGRTKQLTDRIKALNNQNIALVSDIQELKTSLAQAQEQVKVAGADNPVSFAIPQQLAERDEKIDRQSQEIKSLIADNEKLRMEINHYAANPPATELSASSSAAPQCGGDNIRQMNNRIAALTHQNQVLSRKISEFEGGLTPAQPMDKVIEGTRSEQEADAMIAELKARNEKLKVELEMQKHATANAPSFESCGANQGMDIEEKIYLLEQENQRLQTLLDSKQ